VTVLNRMMPLRPARRIGPILCRENVVPVVTPLKATKTKRLEIDSEGTSRLLDHIYSLGARSILVNGTTGEFTRLSNEQRLKALTAFSEASDGWFRIFANATGGSVEETTENIRHAMRVKDVAGIVLAPLFYLDSVGAIAPHIRNIAEKIIKGKLPLILYNNPAISKSGASIGLSLLSQIGGLIAGIKDSSGNLELLEGYAMFTEVGQGDEGQILMALAREATFSVASIGNVVRYPQEMYKAETMDQLFSLQAKILELRMPLTAQLKKIPGALKYCLSRLEICESTVASDADRLTDIEKEEIDKVLPQVRSSEDAACMVSEQDIEALKFAFRMFNARETKEFFRFLRELGVKKGDRIVNIGTSGNHLISLAAQALGAHYLGYDLNAFSQLRVIDYLKRTSPFLEQYGGSAQEFIGEFSSGQYSISGSIPDRSQDHVLILTGALSDPRPVSSAEEVLIEALRVIKPGGRILAGSYGICWYRPERQRAEALIKSVLGRPGFKGKIEMRRIGEISHSVFCGNAGDIYEAVIK